MVLETYRAKRDFTKTAEPAGEPVQHPGENGLRFYIQKHAARRLHYDFRLELDGVLKSWAVPRGPSLDPHEKRLAVHVEDHPVEYGTFEGTIPEGQYGGGTVLLWDQGTWAPEGDGEADLAKGLIKFHLDGQRLKGRWMLVRMGGKAATERHENWLLVKEQDEAAQPGSGDHIVTDNPTGIASGRDLAAIKAAADRVWTSNRGQEADPPVATPTEAVRDADADLPAAKKARGKSPARKSAPRKSAAKETRAKRGSSPLPDTFTPVLASSADVAPGGAEWLHEIKHDGYRIGVRLDRGTITLITRGGLDWTHRFPELAAEAAALPAEALFLDGEIVFLDEAGHSSFSGLQQALTDERTADLVLYVFDLLHRDGEDLTAQPLETRKSILKECVGSATEGPIRYSDHMEGNGPDFFKQACHFALEGIISKRRDSPYRGGRGRDWLKVKCINRDEFVVVGFTDPQGARGGFGSLLLGYYDAEGALHYGGRVGTGFNDRTLAQIHDRLDPLQRKSKPVKSVPKGTVVRDVHWVEPRLVVEVQYTNWTRDDVLRHATFQGIREDKLPTEVVLQRRPGLPPTETAPTPTAAAEPKPGEGPKPATDSVPVARDGSVEIAGIRLSHARKVLYPGQGYSKLDLALYYQAVAPLALAEIGRRPLSLLRCPEGEGKPCFFQKHVGSGVPEGVRKIEVEEAGGKETYLVIDDLSGLVSLVQMGVLEIHPWGSLVSRIEKPDRVTFDLDPDEGLGWDRVVEAAFALRGRLGEFGLASFLKTTGGKGLHVVVPLTPKLDWPEVKAFAKAVAEEFVSRHPDRFTANMAKRTRVGRVFIDYLRNGRGATAVGAYSVRARAGAPVSLPVSWEEIAGALPLQFTLATVPGIVATRADPWAGIADVKQSLTAKASRALKLP